MSKTSVIKQKILEILNDGREHSASEIKEKIRQKSNEDISEGVFAGSFRTLVIEKKCKNPDRGIYVINTVVGRENKKTKEMEKVADVKKNDKYLILKQAVTDSIEKMDSEICMAMKGIDIAVADAEVLEYCLEIKKICGEIKRKFDEVNQMFEE